MAVEWFVIPSILKSVRAWSLLSHQRALKTHLESTHALLIPALPPTKWYSSRMSFDDCPIPWLWLSAMVISQATQPVPNQSGNSPQDGWLLSLHQLKKNFHKKNNNYPLNRYQNPFSRWVFSIPSLVTAISVTAEAFSTAPISRFFGG